MPWPTTHARTDGVDNGVWLAVIVDSGRGVLFCDRRWTHIIGFGTNAGMLERVHPGGGECGVVTGGADVVGFGRCWRFVGSWRGSGL